MSDYNHVLGGMARSEYNSVLGGIAKSAGNVLDGVNNTSSQNETKHYYPEIISMLQQQYAGKLLPGGYAEKALNLQISQMQVNWEGQNHTSYMSNFGVTSLVNQIDAYMQMDQMRGSI